MNAAIVEHIHQIVELGTAVREIAALADEPEFAVERKVSLDFEEPIGHHVERGDENGTLHAEETEGIGERVGLAAADGDLFVFFGVGGRSELAKEF